MLALLRVQILAALYIFESSCSVLGLLRFPVTGGHVSVSIL